jgi:cytochrome oxidase Cu insertion factor (SCO1/SenC/PrrC family)
MVSPRWQARLGLITASAVFLIAFSIVLAGAMEKPNLHIGQPGSPAVAFRLPDVNGKSVSLASLRGSVIVLGFASSPEAETSKKQIDQLAALGQKCAARSDVKLLTIFSGVEDMTPQQRELAEELATGASPGCITLLDPTTHARDRYAIEQTPTFIVIDSAGTIRYRGGLEEQTPDPAMASTSFTHVVDLLLAEKLLPQPAPAVLSNINK